MGAKADPGSSRAVPSNLLKQVASEEMLWTAWDEVAADRGAPGVDGISVRSFGQQVAPHLQRLAANLLARTYRPAPLRRVWVQKISKPDEYRGLSIPTVRDRIAARAAHNVLEHIFEPRFHDS